MNGVLRFLSFGIGATLSTAVLRGLREGAQPDPRAALKEGIRAWLTIVDAAGQAQSEFGAFQADVRADMAKSATQLESRRRITLEPPA